MKLKTKVAVSLGVLVLSGLSYAGNFVPFKATFHGFSQAPTPTDDPAIVEIVVPLHGTGTHLGRFDERLVHYLNVLTGEFTGYADWTAANGDTFRTEFYGQTFQTDDPDWLTFEVTHTIVFGTGRFKNATGSFDGINGMFNSTTGEDFGGYVGTIAY